MKDTQNEIESLKQGSRDINRIIVDDFIYNDDSINTIKCKIAKALGINETSHKELFLYGKYSTNFQLNHFYDDVTKDKTRPLTQNMLEQLAVHWKFNESESQILRNEKQEYNYNDLLKHFHKKQTRIINKPIGFQFAKKYDHFHSASPFDLLIDSNLYHKTETNPLLMLDNSLLLNYGNIEDNVIYCCMADDVYKHFVKDTSFSSDLFEEFTKQYFPLLSKANVYSETLENNRPKMIDDFKNNELNKFNRRTSSINAIHKLL